MLTPGQDQADALGMSLVSCPHCAVPCKLVERDCPHCGKALRSSDGTIPLTAAAAILGLTMSACGPKQPDAVPAYGVAEPDVTTTPEPDPEPAPEPAPTTTPEPPPVSSPTPPPDATAAPAYGVAPVPVPFPPDGD